jgi:hypothetical protein
MLAARSYPLAPGNNVLISLLIESTSSSSISIEFKTSSSLYVKYEYKGEKQSSSKVVTKKPISSIKSKKWHRIHPPIILEVYMTKG